MQPLKDVQNAKKNTKEAKEGENSDSKQVFIFFDFECRQDMKVSENKHGLIFKHVPNLCVAQRVCEDCVMQKEYACPTCGIREHIFRGDDTADSFCEWLLSGEEHAGVIAIAHNARAYDAQFIQDYCFRNAIAPNVILNGSKLLSLTVGEVKVIDSLSF